MKLGLFYEWPNPDLQDWQRLFNETIEGFDLATVAERQRTAFTTTGVPLPEQSRPTTR